MMHLEGVENCFIQATHHFVQLLYCQMQDNFPTKKKDSESGRISYIVDLDHVTGHMRVQQNKKKKEYHNAFSNKGYSW